jgi:phytoene dehydrogenase-like protein
VRATIQEGWHLYSMTTPPGGPKPTVFALVRTDGVEPAGKALQPVPAREFDQNFQVDTEQYSREVEFAVPVRLTDAAPEGPLTLRGTVAFQVCDPKQCIPGKFAWEAPITVVAGPARPEFASVKPGALLAGSDVAQVDAAAPGFSDTIEHLHVQTPLDLERELGLLRGNVMHVEMGLDSMFLYRPLPELAGYRTPVRGLFLTGASTHPGGGVFGASGRTAARVVLANRRRWR